MRKLNICIDIDGTMTDPYYFMPYFNKFFNQDLKEHHMTTYRIDNLYQIGRDEMDQFYSKEGDNMHRNATILPKTKEVMTYLKDLHNLYIVTARSKEMEDTTIEWLKRHEIPDVMLYSLGSYYKVEKAKELDCDIFIEDNPQNSLEIAESGIKVLLMDTNYNKTISHSNIIRVQNWNDIQQHIDKMSRQ